MPGLVKLGRTNNLPKRIKDLSSHTGVPVPFVPYYACQVKDAKHTEKKLHNIFKDSRINKKKEFFRTDPDSIISALELGEGKEILLKDYVEVDKEEKQALDREREHDIRVRFQFSKLGIPEGVILTFKKDESITAKVVGGQKIKFRGKITSTSAAATQVLIEKGFSGKTYAGPHYWRYKGETLYAIRMKMEEDDGAADKREKQALDRKRERIAKVSINSSAALFQFSKLGIPLGAILTFKNDGRITATVVKGQKIKLNGKIMSLSAAATQLLRKRGAKGKTYAGTHYWLYEGETLLARRMRLEAKDSQD